MLGGYSEIGGEVDGAFQRLMYRYIQTYLVQRDFEWRNHWMLNFLLYLRCRRQNDIVITFPCCLKEDAPNTNFGPYFLLL